MHERLSIRDVMARCRVLASSGRRVVNAHIGAPSHDPPVDPADLLSRMEDLAAEYGLEGVGRRYTDFRGVERVREAAADYARRFFGRSGDPDRVVMTASGAHALFVVFSTLMGSEILVPRPGFALYYPQMERAGVVPRFYDPTAGDLRSEILGALGRSTGAVLINYPHNPTGHQPPAGELSSLWEDLRDRGVILINDFVYHEIYYGERPPAVGDVILESSSKSLGLPGIRIGFIYLEDPNLAVRVGRAVYHTTAGTADVTQVLAAEEMRAASHEYFSAVRAHYRPKRDALVSGLRELGFEFPEPRGAFYIFARHPAVSDAYGLAERLLDESREVCVGVVPGPEFGGRSEWIRLSFGSLTDGDVDAMVRELRSEVIG